MLRNVGVKSTVNAFSQCIILEAVLGRGMRFVRLGQVRLRLVILHLIQMIGDCQLRMSSRIKSPVIIVLDYFSLNYVIESR